MSWTPALDRAVAWNEARQFMDEFFREHTSRSPRLKTSVSRHIALLPREPWRNQNLTRLPGSCPVSEFYRRNQKALCILSFNAGRCDVFGVCLRPSSPENSGSSLSRPPETPYDFSTASERHKPHAGYSPSTNCVRSVLNVIDGDGSKHMELQSLHHSRSFVRISKKFISQNIHSSGKEQIRQRINM